MKKRLTALLVSVMLLTGLFAFAGTAMAAPTWDKNPADLWLDEVVTYTIDALVTTWTTNSSNCVIVSKTSGAASSTCQFKFTGKAVAGEGISADGVPAWHLQAPLKYATVNFTCVNTSGQALGNTFSPKYIGPTTRLSANDFAIYGMQCTKVSPDIFPNVNNNDNVSATLTFSTSGSNWSGGYWPNNISNQGYWYNGVWYPGSSNYPGSVYDQGYWYNGVWYPGNNNYYNYPSTTTPSKPANPNAKANVYAGGTLQLTSSMLGGVDPYNRYIYFRSSDTRVATITDSGLVTGIASGTTRITAFDTYGRQYGAWDLTVGDKQAAAGITAITFNYAKRTLKRNSEFQLIAYSKGVPVTINWFSSNPSIASVDTDGWVTTYDRRGKVTITGYVQGGPSRKCTITVK